MTLQTLMYCSRPNELRRGQIDEILASSERNNAASDVTGMLLFDRDHIVQILEGGRNAISETFARILNDPRHRDVAILNCADTRERTFPAWRMRYVSFLQTDQAHVLRFSSGREFAPRTMSADALFGLCVELSRQRAA